MNQAIHQIWFQGKNSMPHKYNETIKSWMQKNPGWRYQFWDEESLSSLISSKYPTYFERWNNLDKIIKKCDAARCFILHQYGGVYADLDTICHKPLDTLIKDFSLDDFDITFCEEAQDVNEHFHWKADLRNLVLKEYGGERFIGNAVLISHEKNIFWLDFLDASFKLSTESVLESFSTWHLSKYLNKHKDSYSITVLPFSTMLSPEYLEDSSYITHNYDATWFNTNTDKPWEG